MLAMTCGRATGETSGIAFVLALEGEVTVTGRDGSTLVIGNHRVLFDGDRVSTGADAWVLFQFHDGSRLVAGPGARLAIGQRTEARRLRLKWRLESGYLRLFAGLACRESLDDCVIETPYGEARVHAALLDAWLCDSDCARNAAAQLRELGEGGGVDGRVVGHSGELFRETAPGVRQRLLSGGPVFLSDTLFTGPGACAVIAWRDGRVQALGESSSVPAGFPAPAPPAEACLADLPGGAIDFRGLFGAVRQAELAQGLYLRVADGHVRLQELDAGIDLGPGEVGYKGNGAATRLRQWPEHHSQQLTPGPLAM